MAWNLREERSCCCKTYSQVSLTNLTPGCSGNETGEQEDKGWKGIAKKLVSAEKTTHLRLVYG